ATTMNIGNALGRLVTQYNQAGPLLALGMGSEKYREFVIDSVKGILAARPSTDLISPDLLVSNWSIFAAMEWGQSQHSALDTHILGLMNDDDLISKVKAQTFSASLGALYADLMLLLDERDDGRGLDLQRWLHEKLLEVHVDEWISQILKYGELVSCLATLARRDFTFALPAYKTAL